MQSRCSRDAVEVQPRCSRGAVEMQSGCGRGAAEMQATAGRAPLGVLAACEESACPHAVSGGRWTALLVGAGGDSSTLGQPEASS